jgi:flagellar protein FliO/FliZ
MDEYSYIRVVASLLLVLGLIVAALWAVRRYGLGGPLLRGNTRRRLGVVEVLAVDGKNRLVLVRRDNREHLVLIGATGSILLERDISPPVAASEETGRV